MLECTDYTDFENKAKVYAALGCAISEISSLEHRIDGLIVAVNETDPELASNLDSKFPRHFDNKIDFIIGLIAINPKLKRIPIFGNGSLDLQWLDTQLTEIFGARAALSHGEVIVTLDPSGHPIYKMTRYVSGKKAEPIALKHTTMGAGFLADLVETTRHLALYFSTLSLAWKGEYDPEEAYQHQKKIDANWSWLKELAVDRGVKLNELLNLKTW